jgi:hypothetical protein
VGRAPAPNSILEDVKPACLFAHTAGNGKVIAQYCNTCHEPLAMDEASPEILKTLGIAERISEIQKL